MSISTAVPTSASPGLTIASASDFPPRNPQFPPVARPNHRAGAPGEGPGRTHDMLADDVALPIQERRLSFSAWLR